MGNPSRVTGPRADRTGVALTFDDGPDPVWTPRMLAALDAVAAAATFFVTPRLGIATIESVAAAGHEVGYHCSRHVRHGERERSEVAVEAYADLELLASAGIIVRCWRPPWGHLAGWTGDLADELGLELRLWDADTEDWAGHPVPRMLDRIGPAIRPGAVVLMHDGIGPGALRADPASTVELVEPLVELIRDCGLEPEPVSRVTPGGLDRVAV